MNLITLLKNDHRQVEKLFEKIMKPRSSFDKQKEMFTTLKELLNLHSKTEEKFLYPQMEKTRDGHDLTLEAYEEHHMVKILLQEIPLVREKDVWEAKVLVLQEQVKHHVQEEELKLFPLVEQRFSKEDLNQLAKDIEEWRENSPQEHYPGLMSRIVQQLGFSK